MKKILCSKPGEMEKRMRKGHAAPTLQGGTVQITKIEAWCAACARVVHLWNPIWKTMKSAAGKRPPDETHGPWKEAIRPRQLCLEEHRSDFKNAAKIRQTCSQCCSVLFKIDYLFSCHMHSNWLLSFPSNHTRQNKVQIGIQHWTFTNVDDIPEIQQFLQKRSRYPNYQISWYFATKIDNNFQKMAFEK